jgi:hypothetical protein
MSTALKRAFLHSRQHLIKSKLEKFPTLLLHKTDAWIASAPNGRSELAQADTILPVLVPALRSAFITTSIREKWTSSHTNELHENFHQFAIPAIYTGISAEPYPVRQKLLITSSPSEDDELTDS